MYLIRSIPRTMESSLSYFPRVLLIVKLSFATLLFRSTIFFQICIASSTPKKKKKKKEKNEMRVIFEV